MTASVWEDRAARAWCWAGSGTDWASAKPSAVNASLFAEYAGQFAEYAGPRRYGSDWYGAGASCEGSRALIATGWPEGAAWARSVLPTVEVPAARCARRRIVRGDWGDTVDPAAALVGDVDIMWSRGVREDRQGARPLSIVVQGTGACFESHKTFKWRMVAPVLLLDALAAAGYAASLWIVSGVSETYRGRSPYQWTAAEVSRAGEPITMESIAAAVGSIGSVRSAGFAAMVSGDAEAYSYFGHHNLGSGAAFWAQAPASIRERIAAGGEAVMLDDARDAAGAGAVVARAMESLHALAGPVRA